MRDLYNNIAARRAISPVAVSTNGGKVSQIIDRQGFDSLAFLVNYGEVSSATAVVGATLKEADTTDGSFSSVAAGDLLGTESAAGLAAGTRVSGTTKNVTKKIGYRGNKRYVTLTLLPVGTAAAIMSADAVLMNPGLSPVA